MSGGGFDVADMAPLRAPRRAKENVYWTWNIMVSVRVSYEKLPDFLMFLTDLEYFSLSM